MLSSCLDYLEAKLKEAGINKVSKKQEDAGGHQVIPSASITVGEETLRRVGSLVAVLNDPAANLRVYRKKLYSRVIPFKVKIVQRDAITAENMGTSFIASLDRRILDSQGNAVLITAREAEPEENTSILNQKGTVEYQVIFEGGIYLDKTHKLYSTDTALEISGEIETEV